MSENEKMKKYCECMKYIGRVQANAIFVQECKIDSNIMLHVLTEGPSINLIPLCQFNLKGVRGVLSEYSQYANQGE